MSEIAIGSRVIINLKPLLLKFGEKLMNGMIHIEDPETLFCSLYDEDDELIYIDGYECVVRIITDECVVIENDDFVDGSYIYLSKEEFDISAELSFGF